MHVLRLFDYQQRLIAVIARFMASANAALSSAERLTVLFSNAIAMLSNVCVATRTRASSADDDAVVARLSPPFCGADAVGGGGGPSFFRPNIQCCLASTSLAFCLSSHPLGRTLVPFSAVLSEAPAPVS